MKAKLIFDLEDADDRMAHLRCVKSLDMADILFQLSHNTYKDLINQVQGGKNENEVAYLEVGIKLFHKRLCEQLQDKGIVIEELIR